jgi:hypothetical protein
MDQTVSSSSQICKRISDRLDVVAKNSATSLDEILALIHDSNGEPINARVYCNNLRNTIRSCTDEIIENSLKTRKAMIQEVDAYEAEALNAFCSHTTDPIETRGQSHKLVLIRILKNFEMMTKVFVEKREEILLLILNQKNAKHTSSALRR